jgi:hypothetical protein
MASDNLLAITRNVIGEHGLVGSAELRSGDSVRFFSESLDQQAAIRFFDAAQCLMWGPLGEGFVELDNTKSAEFANLLDAVILGTAKFLVSKRLRVVHRTFECRSVKFGTDEWYFDGPMLAPKSVLWKSSPVTHFVAHRNRHDAQTDS